MMLARDVAATGCGSRVQFWPCSRPRASRGSSTSGTGLVANATGLAQYPAAVAPQDWRQPIRQAPAPPAQHLPPSRPPLSATPPQDTTHTVDVQLMVKYSCNFGQHLAVVSSNQGWDTSSASQLTWAAGDKWSTVLSLPVGSDVEYKYVVMEGSHVQRWQEGPNNRLALHTPGVLVQVTDCWSRESRQVYELGLPAAAWQQPQQRQKHGSGAAAAAAAAAGSRLHDNMGRLGSAAAPQEDTQLPQDLAPSQAGQDAAQAQQQHSEHGITVEPDALTLEVAQLIPMLQHELQLALEALASHPGHDCSEQAALLAEGEAVLAALRRQEQHSSSPAAGSAAASSNGSGVGGFGSSALSSLLSSCFSSSDEEGLLDEVEAAFASCSPDSALAAAATSATVTHAAAAAAAAAAAESVASLSQQLHQHSHDADTPVRGSSPGSSVGSAMASEDDITAALLSDDFEDACLCLHDAICSCQEYAHLPECRGYHSSSSVSAEPAAEPAAMQAADAAVVQLASSTAASSTALQPSAAAKAAAATGELVPTTAVAVAASYADAAAARAAAFAGVQEALERSGALLDALADPTHPLMLAADRELAAAKRQMGHLLAA